MTGLFITSSSSWPSFFFFLMIRRPPRSTLFPTRRSSDLAAEARDVDVGRGAADGGRVRRQGGKRADHPLRRSEEHTSELQSRLHLVCRLLLEKKKKS